MRYIGFGGLGHQIRDAFHPDDLADLLLTQMRHDPPEEPVFNVGGGAANAMSLAELTEWCDHRFGSHAPQPDTRERPFDVPWLVMDSRKRSRNSGGRQSARFLGSSTKSPATQGESELAEASGAGLTRVAPDPNRPPLQLLSVIIPARDEEGCIVSTVEHLHL